MRDLAKFYRDRDLNSGYERQWGYLNEVAAAYWRLRDQLVFKSIGYFQEHNPNKLQILEVGTGHGHELAKFSLMGIPQSSLYGVDLLFDRITWAKNIYPAMNLQCADARALPFSDNSFDLVFQFTCFMHLTDPGDQITAAAEMMRVLTPNGTIIWWDLAPIAWYTSYLKRIVDLVSRQKFPLNRVRRTAAAPSESNSSKGVVSKRYSKADLARLFPSNSIDIRSAGLEYTVWDHLYRRSPTLANMLWLTGVLNEHYFAVIRKRHFKKLK